MIHSVTFCFSGDLPQASFAEFARHRAGRLSLQMDLLEQTDTWARLTIRGQADLVDAFEMALSLGPQDCLVRDVDRTDTTAGPKT